MEKFCIKCGKKGVEGLYCNECRETILKTGEIKLKFCVECKRVLYKNRWSNKKPEEIILKKIKKDNPGIEASIIMPELEYKPGLKKSYNIEVVIDKDIFLIPFKAEFSYCDKCRKKTSQYYEGVLQLRTKDKEIIKRVEKELKKADIHISKTEERKNGRDYYITDKKLLARISEKLYKIYGGKIKKSQNLFSRDRQTSKNIYRVNIMLEPPAYKKNDVVSKDNKLLKIIKLGKTVKALNLKNNKTITVRSAMLESATILKIYKAQIVKIYPNIEIISPVNFQQEPLKNRPESKKIGDYIKVVNYKGGWWAV